ncbi:MAG: acyltransferase [Taibaiella sp.]|nr:acyltransferase [Taibaiella sp.]
MSLIDKLLLNPLYTILSSGRYKAFSQKKMNHWAQSNLKKFGGKAYFEDIKYIKNPKYISVGNNFASLYNLRLEAWDYFAGIHFTPELIIGDNVNFNSDIHISAIDKIVIGNNVLLASRIYISDHAHGEINAAALALAPSLRPLHSKGPVIIEDNVWIGSGVCILPGVTIGANSIIGANSVVNKSYPPNSVIGGIPAKLLKSLKDE